MTYIIGDTIRLKATIKNLLGVEQPSTGLTVGVYKLDGTVLFSTGTPTLSTGTTAQYYYDWTIAGTTGVGGTLTKDTKLVALWEWEGPHQKELVFDVGLSAVRSTN